MDLVKSVVYPAEVVALFKFKLGQCDSVTAKSQQADAETDLGTCYVFLDKTSRSFAAVIRKLDPKLRDAVCLFYLVLRALDTVEDDMTIDKDEKIVLLQNFYKYLQQHQWKYEKSQEKDKQVLEQFPVISSEFRKLSTEYQAVISDICQKMGNGMVKYLDRSPDSLDEWDEYCHYVAGLVGLGLSQLFSISGLESAKVGEDSTTSNSMGLFLQKTNIIRDYLEDVQDERHFWPQQVWGKYSSEMLALSEPSRLPDALSCLNELVTNALHHIPDVISYMARLQDQTVFNFCAIPQVMAIATLERCYNNPHVFSGVVKIRKGEAVRLMMEATNMKKLYAIFVYFLHQIKLRIPSEDPCQARTHAIIDKCLSLCQTDNTFSVTSYASTMYASATLLAATVCYNYGTALVDILV